MCQKPMIKFVHQIERERRATLKTKNQSQNFLKKLVKTLGIGTFSKVLVKSGGKND
jgi:hypothetical protein